LHALDCLELILGCEKIPVPRYAVALRHKIGIARHSSAVAITSDEGIFQLWARLEKCLRDVTNSSLVLLGELEKLFLFQILHYTRDICLEKSRNRTMQFIGAKQRFECGIRCRLDSAAGK